jgi:hypothetical protein
MNNSPFHVILVVGLEVQITTCMNGFPVHFHGQFRTPLHDEDIKEWKSIIHFTSIVNLMVGLRLLRWWRNCCNLAGTYGQTTKVSLAYLSHLAVVSCIQCYFLKVFCKYITDPLLYPPFADGIYPHTRSMQLLNKCPVIPLCLQLLKVSILGKKDPYLVYFLWPVRLLPLVQWWIDIKSYKAVFVLKVDLVY